MTRCILILLLFLSSKLYAEDLVAVMDLKFIEDTGETAAVLCFGDNDQDCGQWATFYLYEATVKKVLSGSLPSKKFKVIYGRHALMQKNFKNVPATLTRLAEHDEAEYKIEEWGVFRKMYCFSGEYNQHTNVSEVKEGQQLRCYEEEEL